MSRRSSLGEFRVLSLRETRLVGYEVSGPDKCVQYWKDHVETAPWFDPDKEHAVVLCLDTKVRAIGHNLVSVGTVGRSDSWIHDLTGVAPGPSFQ